jgi:phosphomannomutase
MAALADSGGVVGGEGNGSVAMPSFSRAFDAFLMMGLILEAMATTGSKPSALLGMLPRYHIVKKQAYGEPHRCYRALESLNEDADWQAGGRRDLTDGLRLDWEDGWLHMRASQTEPMVRIISESRSKQKAADRASEAVRILEQRL